MKVLLGLILLVVGFATAIYVGIYIMLYCGIMQAVNNFGTDNGAVVWGIIRAVFFGAGGLCGLPFYVAGVICFKD